MNPFAKLVTLAAAVVVLQVAPISGLPVAEAAPAEAVATPQVRAEVRGLRLLAKLQAMAIRDGAATPAWRSRVAELAALAAAADRLSADHLDRLERLAQADDVRLDAALSRSAAVHGAKLRNGFVRLVRSRQATLAALAAGGEDAVAEALQRREAALAPGDAYKVEVRFMDLWDGHPLSEAAQLAYGGVLFHHYGVYVGEGMVVDYGHVAAATAPGHIEIQFITLREMDSKAIGAKAPAEPVARLDRARIVARAISRIGTENRRYNLLLHNCEHFTAWARTGAAVCRQTGIAIRSAF